MIASFNSRVLLDIHETIFLDNRRKSIQRIFRFIYQNLSNNVIYHSNNTKIELTKLGFKNKLIYVPHFHYSLKKSYSIDHVGFDLQNSISRESINLLFFGNIRPSKGIYELLSIIRSFNAKLHHCKLNFIIAGQDIFNVLPKLILDHLPTSNFKILLRYVNDDEMCYLFSHVDYILLPYREISQSGILEVAFSFRKPIIASKIKYFQEIIDLHPSFGYTMDFLDQNAINHLVEIIENDKGDYYTDIDIKKYYKSEEFNNFILKLRNKI